MFKKTHSFIKFSAAMLLCSSFAFAQTVINNSNFTFSGLYTPSPPVLDGDPSDACWSNVILGGEPNPNRISNGVFPNAIGRVNNLNDVGIASGAPPAGNPIPSGASASFSTTWDLDYFYFIVKVIDPRVISKTAPNSMQGEGVYLYFNNGNGRSSFAPGDPYFPRKYDNAKDMQVVFNYTSYSAQPRALLLSNGEFANYGIPLNFTGYDAIAKGTTDGYIIEGRISWKVINIEFIDPISEAYIDYTKKPLPTRIPFGFDVAANFSNASFSSQESQLMWNQCCWNTNWSQSQHFGVLKLASTPKIFTATGVSISELNNGALQINTGGTPLDLKATITPTDAPQNVMWSVQGNTAGGFPRASIDQFGRLSPLNNGSVTVTATTFPVTIVDGSIYIPQIPNGSVIPSVSTTTTVVISNQVAPTIVNISSPTIDVNWGTSLPTASVGPANSPSLVSWSMIDPNGLATMNTLTGQVTSKSLANGSVTIVGTSLANGTIGRYTLPIIKQSPISCFVINAYTNINQTNRTKTNLTFSGFNPVAGVLKTKIRLIPQYVNQYVVTTPGIGNSPGYLSSEIPDDLVTITGVFSPSNSGQLQKTGAGWEVSFNQLNANPVTITAVYLNNTAITNRIIGVVRYTAPITSTGTCGYDIRNFETNAVNPGCNPGYSIPGICINNNNSVALTSATISGPTSATIGGSALYTLVNYLPSNATTPVSTQWNSSNPSVATINSSGQLTLLAVGSTTISTTHNNAANVQISSNSIVVNVVSVAGVSNVALSSATISGPTSATIGGSALYTLVNYLPSNATTPVSTQWNSSNPSVATINSSGQLTLLAVGSTTISTTHNNAANVQISSNSIVLNVVSVAGVSNVALQSTTITGPSVVTVGGIIQYAVVGYTPSNATLPISTQWNSSNSSVAIINANGQLITLTEGLTTVFAIQNNAMNNQVISNSIIVNVKDNKLSVLNDKSTKEAITIYPNPTIGSFTISSENGSVYIITDLLGRKLAEGLLTNGKAEVSDLNLTSGIYLVGVGQYKSKLVVR